VCANGRITIEEAVNIAKKEACKASHFYCSEDFEMVDADENNNRWHECIKLNPNLLEIKSVIDMELENKKYWAIFIQRKEKKRMVDNQLMTALGDDKVIVFIDKGTGKLIGYLFGI
jgi:hypothetical protein